MTACRHSKPSTPATSPRMSQPSAVREGLSHSVQAAHRKTPGTPSPSPTRCSPPLNLPSTPAYKNFTPRRVQKKCVTPSTSPIRSSPQSLQNDPVCPQKSSAQGGSAVLERLVGQFNIAPCPSPRERTSAGRGTAIIFAAEATLDEDPHAPSFRNIRTSGTPHASPVDSPMERPASPKSPAARGLQRPITATAILQQAAQDMHTPIAASAIMQQSAGMLRSKRCGLATPPTSPTRLRSCT